MKTLESKETVFAISLGNLQYEAKEKIGRELKEEELYIAKKVLSIGLLMDIDKVYEAIFTKMINQ